MFDGITTEDVALLNTSKTDDPERITFTPLKEAVYPVVTAFVKLSVAVADVNPTPEAIELVAEDHSEAELTVRATNNDVPP